MSLKQEKSVSFSEDNVAQLPKLEEANALQSSSSTIESSSSTPINKKITKEKSDIIEQILPIDEEIDKIQGEDMIVTSPGSQMNGGENDGDEKENYNVDLGQDDDVEPSDAPVPDALEALFLEVDKNNDGDVSRKEIMHVLNEKDGHHNLLKERVCVTLGLPPKIQGREARDVFNAIFDCVDSDNTQTISLQEMRHFVENVEIFVEMYAEVAEGIQIAWPISKEVYKVLKFTRPRKDGTLDHAQIIHTLQKYPEVREAVEDRRANGPPRKKVTSVKLHSRLTKEQSMNLDAMFGTKEGLTEEEELDQAMEEEEPLTEEEIAAKATEEYWETKANAFMSVADSRDSDGCLSIREIEDFMLKAGDNVDKDDKWFVHWLLVANMGGNFKRYDHDGSGEIDVLELRTALMEFAIYAQAETLKKAEKQRAMLKRKKELAAERLEMLKDADARAKEIVTACIKGSNDGSITMTLLKSKIGNMSKFKPFVSWLLKDNMAVFKRFDHDRSGTMEVTELESALDQYFDEVAAEFDELREDDVGRSQPRVVNGPPPPLLRKCGDADNISLLLEYESQYKGREVELQGMKILCAKSQQQQQPGHDDENENNSHQSCKHYDEASRGGDGGCREILDTVTDRWCTIHTGHDGAVEVRLSEPSALFIFRTSTPKPSPAEETEAEEKALEGIELKFIPEHSAEVFWIGKPEPPTLCGLGCNVLASWVSPHIPAKFHHLRPPIPIWKIHTRKVIHHTQMKKQQQTSGNGLANNKLEHEEVTGGEDNEDDEDWVVTKADLGATSCVVSGLKLSGGSLGAMLNRYEICLSCELPCGHSVLSDVSFYSTSISSPEVINESVCASTTTQQTQQGILVQLPQPVDPDSCLAHAGVVTHYCTEGLNSEGVWEFIYEGSESRLKVSGVPYDSISAVRSKCSLDLRNLARYGSDKINILPCDSSKTTEFKVIQPAFGCRDGVAYSDGTWPGASRARSSAYTSLFNSKPISLRACSWDTTPSVTLCLPPSPLTFDGDAADFSSTLDSRHCGNAKERLSLLWAKPKSIISEARKGELMKKGNSLGLMGMMRGGTGNAKLSKDIAILCSQIETEYVCEVYDNTSGGGGGGWRRVYKGKDNICHLTDYMNNQTCNNDSLNWANRTNSFESFKTNTEPTTCLLVRSGRRFINSSTVLNSTCNHHTENDIQKKKKSTTSTEMQRRHSIQYSRSSSFSRTSTPRTPSAARSQSAGSKRPTTPNVGEGNGGWKFSVPIIAVLSPPPPLCRWADSGHRGVMVSWGDRLDQSKLPLGYKIKPERFALEVASGPLMADELDGMKEHVTPLVNFEEVAESTGPYEVHSGLLQPGTRYAFRVRLITANGSGVSSPYYIATQPTVPAPPAVPTAISRTFRSATGNTSSYLQLSWIESDGNGCAVDRYLLQSRTVTHSDDRDDVVDDAYSEWKTVYLGPQLTVGDHTTLGTKLKSKRQYRLQAGSKLGWSQWSSLLTVQRPAKPANQLLPTSSTKQDNNTSNIVPPLPFTVNLETVKDDDDDDDDESFNHFKSFKSNDDNMIERIRKNKKQCKKNNEENFQKVKILEENSLTCSRHLSLSWNPNNIDSEKQSIKILHTFDQRYDDLVINQTDIENCEIGTNLNKLAQNLRIDSGGNVVFCATTMKQQQSSSSNDNNELSLAPLTMNTEPIQLQPTNETNETSSPKGIQTNCQPLKCLFLSPTPVTYCLTLTNERKVFLRMKFQSQYTSSSSLSYTSSSVLSPKSRERVMLIELLSRPCYFKDNQNVKQEAVLLGQLILTQSELEELDLLVPWHKRDYDQIGVLLCKQLLIDELNHSISILNHSKHSVKCVVHVPWYPMKSIEEEHVSLQELSSSSSCSIGLPIQQQLSSSTVSNHTVYDETNHTIVNSSHQVSQVRIQQKEDELAKRVMSKVKATLGFAVSDVLLKHVVSSSLDTIQQNNLKNKFVGGDVTLQRNSFKNRQNDNDFGSISSLTIMVNTATLNMSKNKKQTEGKNAEYNMKLNKNKLKSNNRSFKTGNPYKPTASSKTSADAPPMTGRPKSASQKLPPMEMVPLQW